TGQFDAGRGGFFTGGGGLLGDVADVEDTAADFFGHRALLLGRSGDLLVHRLNVRHGV
nr:hypothetical protein [Tanacetum cinerariifolium]